MYIHAGVAFVLTMMSLDFGFAQSQDVQPIRWDVISIPIKAGEAKVVFTASLEDGWHVYSQFLEQGGPMPTMFTFVPDPSYELVGNVTEESTPVKSFDNVFMMEIVWFKKTAVFSQVVKLKSPHAKISGKIEYMGCNDFMCLPPNEKSFSVEVRAASNDKPPKGK